MVLVFSLSRYPSPRDREILNGNWIERYLYKFRATMFFCVYVTEFMARCVGRQAENSDVVRNVQNRPTSSGISCQISEYAMDVDPRNHAVT